MGRCDTSCRYWRATGDAAVDVSRPYRYAHEMARTTKSKDVPDCETALAKLVEHLSPGSITITKPKYSVLKQRTAYELTALTRESSITFVADSIAEVARDAFDAMTDGTEDPIVPAWSRLSRYQRQIVVQTLREHAARHMARAAEAKITCAPSSYTDYEVADAFQAAIATLDYDDLDEQHALLEREKLAAEKPIKITQPRTKPRAPVS